jgi:hypothetical protein
MLFAVFVVKKEIPVQSKSDTERCLRRRPSPEDQSLPPAMQEYFKKFCDFRPWDCERCCQLAVEYAILVLLPLLVFAPRGERCCDLMIALVDRHHDEEHRHLLHERHVLALLPQSEEEVK